MNITEYADQEMMAIDLANKLAGELTTTLEHEERALLVVPGGTTPGPVFDGLCDADLDWARVDVMLSDERWVPEVHVRSNTRLIRERLLTGRAAKARYVPLYAPAGTPEDVLPEIEDSIAPRLPISVLLLGMGVDMHTASLFPGADKLGLALERNAPLLVPMRGGGAPEPRVSLSVRALNTAITKHLVITGQQKRAALERARGLSPTDAPVAAVLAGMNVHWAE